jgi:hypothetical protein
MGVGAVGNRVLGGCPGPSYALESSSLIRGRTDPAERRMATPLVVEHFDIIDQRHLPVAAAGLINGDQALTFVIPA